MKALVALCLFTGIATADTWKTTRGTLEPGRAPNSFFLTSDGAPGRYSEAGMITAEPIALPYSISATWRRVGPEAGRSMHVFVAGGVVLIKAGAIAFYAYDDAAFAQGDWKDIPGHLAQAEHVVKVTQDAKTVLVFLDGTEVAHYDLAVARTTASIGFGMKSAPGYRSAIYLRNITVTH